MILEKDKAIDCGPDAYWAMINKFSQFLIIDNEYVKMPDFENKGIGKLIDDLTDDTYWRMAIQGQFSCIHHTKNLGRAQGMVSDWARDTASYKKDSFVNQYLSACVFIAIMCDIQDSMKKALNKED